MLNLLVEVANRGTRHCKSPIHLTDVWDLPYDIANMIVNSKGGNLEHTIIKVAKSFHYVLININGKRALIEVDDDSDPGRSVIKYWPLLHYYKDSELKNYDLIFIEVFRKGSTFGGGYKALAEFIGERFNKYYSKFYKFYLIDAYNREVDNIVSEIAERLKGSY